jgi:phytoene synthase
MALAYKQCRQVAQQTARNFYYSFLVLPRPKRSAMCALYAFLRGADDIGDSFAPIEDRRRALHDWRSQLEDVLAGRSPQDLWWIALADTIKRYAIPVERLHEVVDGVASDLDTFRYRTFADLYGYCYRVASAVGLACLPIWGASDPRATAPAEACGIAFQLTNVLRDLVEDYDRGRIYLPQEDLDRFGVTDAMIARRQPTDELNQLLQFEIDRARSYYRTSLDLTEYLPATGRAILSVMYGVYGGLLGKIADRPMGVLEGRISLPATEKIGYVLRALPIRYLGQSMPIPAVARP